jgi:hypothetical protein
MTEFRFKPEQLTTLWNTSLSSDDLKHITSLPESQPQFILSDEQFSSLLRSASTSHPRTYSKSTTSMKPNLEAISPSIPILPDQLNVSTDMQKQVSSTLADQLTAMQERLKSSVQDHIETVKIVSNSMLKRNRIESTVNLIHQLNLHSMDDASTKEVEAIPSFVFDLLKMDKMTESTYKSIQQVEVTSNVLDKSNDLITSDNINKTIIEGIQSHQLSFSQIHKIQTQLLTPKLIGKNFILHL